MSLSIRLAGKVSDRIGRRPALWIGALSTAIVAVPVSLLVGIGSVAATLAGLAPVAFPVAFYVPILASALPAQFGNPHRYVSMGIRESAAATCPAPCRA